MKNPDWRHLLTEAINYDLYANRLWLPSVVTSELTEATIVYKHILGASKIWVTRLGGTSLPAMPDVDLTDSALAELHGKWIDAVSKFEFDEVIHYRNLAGEPYSRAFGDIARHVLNHATYHRGQIRSLFGVCGLEFPETDFIRFTLDRDENP